MIVSVNMSKDVYEYYKDYDLSKVADTLLEMFDFTALPAATGRREIERRINVSNEAYISLYNAVGPRSKKVSIGRLFAYGYELDVLSMPRFESVRKTTNVFDNPTRTCVKRAYKSLLEAMQYDKSDTLKNITNIVYKYMEALEYEED